ncbi:DUF1275 family protein [Sphingomonas qomolangmaensis]|uniref:DUF1275 family protein n=1 Tax=Sphingomonas qomolangmaensis TaxID=2918765 RepID=A0ABY5LB33_9SPHN|nr:DUF1275 family protein [Sphingomonas qomolangmaensis]UUL83982.1 DUF1275 family protein [Sphingomonas qomolangmaensis]
MVRYDMRIRLLAASLSALAGFVDAVGFVHLGGFFVSFMSGNTTRIGVGLSERGGDAVVAGGLILSFVAGVVFGSLVGRRFGTARRSAVLALVAALLGLAALLAAWGYHGAAAVAMALAMGAENAVFAEGADIHIGLTYMTGTLVKLGQHIAIALGGGDRFGWAPYLLLWAGLLAGGVAGAASYAVAGMGALWAAAAAAGIAAIIAARIGSGQRFEGR